MIELIRRIGAAQAVIDMHFGKPFAWGSHDCVHLASSALNALGYADVLKGVRRYSSARGALSALRRRGFTNLIEAVDGYGLVRISPASALPGDLVSMPSDDPHWTALGVVIGDNRVICFADEGEGTRGTYLSLQAADIAWRSV